MSDEAKEQKRINQEIEKQLRKDKKERTQVAFIRYDLN